MNQARNRTVGNTLFMGIANLTGSCDQALTVSCIVMQFANEFALELARFCGLCMREYDLI